MREAGPLGLSGGMPGAAYCQNIGNRKVQAAEVGRLPKGHMRDLDNCPR